LYAAVGVAAQDEATLDDLFEDPVDDTVAAAPVTDHLTQYVSSDTVIIAGSFEAVGGVLAGWTTWPSLAALSTGFDGTIGLSSTVTVTMDARPDPDFRLYGAMSTSVNPIDGVYGWPAFSLGELFIDYTWLGNTFIRLGRHAMTWGQGRLFEAVTNIMADSGSAYSLRISQPTWLNGVSGIALIKGGYFESGVGASYRQVCYAVKLDEIIGGTLVSLGARYQVTEGINSLLSIKKVVLGVDILADVAVRYDDELWSPQVLVGFFKEWQDLKAYGEYYYSGTVGFQGEHKAGLAVGYNNVGDSAVDVGAQLVHYFNDHSGTATAVVTWTPWKYITATVGLPVVYGAEGSRAVLQNTDAAKRRLLVAFGLEMNVSF
jgi:hypothetical protein